VSKATPNLAIVGIELENLLEVLNSFVELLLCPKNATDGIHCRDGAGIGAKGVLISRGSLLKVVE
jgi:hypothetical protein